LPIPETLDYDLWCGPARKEPVYRDRIQYDCSFTWNMGDGESCNQGVHQVDIARWLLGETGLPRRVMSVGGRFVFNDAGEVPNTQIIYYDYEKVPILYQMHNLRAGKNTNAMPSYRGYGVGLCVQCDGGYAAMAHGRGDSSIWDNHNKKVKHFTGAEDHFANFIEALRSGKRADLHAEILEGHLSTNICHAGNISHRLGKKSPAAEIRKQIGDLPVFQEMFDGYLKHLKAHKVDSDESILGPWLECDRDRECFKNNVEANKLVRGSYREPFIVPEVTTEMGQVAQVLAPLGAQAGGASTSPVRVSHLSDKRQFAEIKAVLENDNPGLRLTLVAVDGESVLHSEHGGMRVFWIYRGNGEVFVPKGYRTQEGDGGPLPAEYKPANLAPAFADVIRLFEDRLASLTPAATVPVRRIVGRLRGGAFVGNYAGDLWTLEHLSRPWSNDKQVEAALDSLFHMYREQGFSTKQVDSYEPIMGGDQLIACAQQEIRVRGRFKCLAMENVGRSTSHESMVRRLRYLLDTAGGCNPDFDPFRRLPLTWFPNHPGESGDGLNWVNSHVVNIPKETSPTHFHPPKAVGGTTAQREMYLVLDPEIYKLNTWGRTASLIVYPDLRNLHRYEEYHLEPEMFIYIPPGTGHRGLDAFVNVLTIPGFRPHNEYYLDRDIRDQAEGKSPYNEKLLDSKNYRTIEELL
jgi:mannose-6-phosphate isomerase-like protein (cupin superfamily)